MLLAIHIEMVDFGPERVPNLTGSTAELDEVAAAGDAVYLETFCFQPARQARNISRAEAEARSAYCSGVSQ